MPLTQEQIDAMKADCEKTFRKGRITQDCFATLPAGQVLELIKEVEAHRINALVNPDITHEVRCAAKKVTGGNCRFADDDIAVLSHLAGRAVESGLTDQISESIQKPNIILCVLRQWGVRYG